MRPQDLIEKKRDGGELSRDEIAFLIRGYTRDEIPDYQMSAWLMAVYLKGMTEAETLILVEEMLYSGEVLTHPELALPKVDKHSTGGVGDKTSLVIAPVAAACGVAVPMISGRALAHTGGTLDKLEAIPGFRTNLSLQEFREVLKTCGLALIGQTREIAPADRKLYALRDVTATVPCRPLICASIMSKKIAEGIDGLVLDVKVGNGAFMREFSEAQKLATTLIDIGRRMGLKVVALITGMEQPLGRCVGNALETKEAIATLRGDLKGDFADLSVELAAHMLMVGGVKQDFEAARKDIQDAITTGAGLDRFRAVIEAQGGDPRVLDDPTLLPKAKYERAIVAKRSGFVSGMATDKIGSVVMDWGGGRRKLEDSIDHSVGVYLNVKLGERVAAGEPLLTAHFNDESRFDEMATRIRAAYRIDETAPLVEPLIKAVIDHV